MKTFLTRAFLVAGLLAFTASVFAADAKPGDAKKELQQLIAKVRDKLRQGKRTEQDLADELKEFDALLKAHEKEKTDDAETALIAAFRDFAAKAPV